MRRVSLNTRAWLGVLVALFLLASLIPARWANALWHRPHVVVVKVLGPFTHQLKRVADTLRAPESIEISPEYRLDLQQRRYFEQRITQLEQENAELRGLRGHFQAQNVRFVKALVTFWSGSRNTPTITINRGSHEGIRQGQVVTLGVQLVGRIAQVDRDLAAVGLITRPNTSLSVRIVPPPDVEPAPRDVRVRARMEASGKQFIAVVPTGEPVRVGDVAHLADESYPHQALGAVVGVVQHIEPLPEDPTLWNRIEIQPTIALHQVDRVWVWVIEDSASAE